MAGDTVIIGNWNDTLPAAPTGYENIKFQVNRGVDPAQVSGYIRKNEPCFLYTSANPAESSTSERFYPHKNSSITGVRINVVKGDGTRVTDVRVLKNGSAIFSTTTKPDVAQGEYVSDFILPDTTAFTIDDYLQIQIVDNAATTGQIRVYIKFI